MKIRDYVNSDLAELVNVYNQSREPVACFKSEDASADDIRALTKNETIQVAEVDSQVIGFISVWVPERFVHHLYVTPSHQNQGAAGCLIHACRRRYGLPLSLKTLAANRSACDFYERNNWVLAATGQGSEGAYHQYRLLEA